MENLIVFFKTQFPKDSIDIQECIELLNQSIGGSVENIKGSFNIALDNRDYEKLARLQEILKSVDGIQNKLYEYSTLLQLDDEIEEQICEKGKLQYGQKELTEYALFEVDQNMPYTLYDDYTYKKPAAFEIFGIRNNAKDWKEVLVKTCEILAKNNPQKFNKFVGDDSMQGKKTAYFSKEKHGIRAARHVKGTDIYIMSNMSANQIRNVIERMLRRYEIEKNDFKIYLRADYTARHE